MPKQPVQPPVRPAGKQVTFPTRADRMVARLRENWRLGREAVAAEKSTARVSTAAFAEARGLSEHTVRKLKAFAKSYKSKELNKLCELRRPNGLPLHWGYVIYLMTVEKAAKAQGADGKAARKEFAKLAAENGWTAPQLHAEIRRKYRRQPGHGRAMVLPGDLQAAMRQVIDQGRAWGKRLEMLMDKMSGRKKVPVSAARELQALLKTVGRLVDQSGRKLSERV